MTSTMPNGLRNVLRWLYYHPATLAAIALTAIVAALAWRLPIWWTVAVEAVLVFCWIVGAISASARERRQRRQARAYWRERLREEWHDEPNDVSDRP